MMLATWGTTMPNKRLSETDTTVTVQFKCPKELKERFFAACGDDLPSVVMREMLEWYSDEEKVLEQ